MKLKKQLLTKTQEMKKEITKNEHLQIIGLMQLAKDAYQRVKECESAYGELVGIDEDCGSYGHFSDEIFGDKNIVVAVRDILRNEGIRVKVEPQE